MGGPRCVTYFFGGPKMCDKVRQREKEGSKLAKNSMTYFMDGPLPTTNILKAIKINISWCKEILPKLQTH